ncbi:MAG: hypothetical protein V4681_01460 [Patescibacteria group bacterium]
MRHEARVNRSHGGAVVARDRLCAMNRRYILLLGALGLAALLLITPVILPPATDAIPEPVANQGMLAETYVREHISELSPLPEVLGGTFYVTSIHADSGAGIVSYEDGHNAYTADFRYASDSGKITVTSFVIRK